MRCRIALGHHIFSAGSCVARGLHKQIPEGAGDAGPDIDYEVRTHAGQEEAPMKARLATLAVLALLVPALTGCGKEPTAPARSRSEAPTVPPASSLKFDFGFFSANGGAQAYAAHPNGVDATLAKSNWINAVVRVVYINLTVADLFTPPVAALQAALSQTPVLGEDGWFNWTYAFSDKGHDITLHLRARIDGNIVTWRMQATDPQASPPMSEFLWFTGETRLQNDRGFWIFNDRRNGEAVPVARVDWTNASERSRTLSFSNVDATSADLGDRLEYSVAGDLGAIRFHDVSANQDADITWNEVTGTGSLTVPDYNNGERACWDEHQENAVCPD
jgi:hypothetical protein